MLLKLELSLISVLATSKQTEHSVSGEMNSSTNKPDSKSVPNSSATKADLDINGMVEPKDSLPNSKFDGGVKSDTSKDNEDAENKTKVAISFKTGGTGTDSKANSSVISENEDGTSEKHVENAVQDSKSGHDLDKVK